MDYKKFTVKKLKLLIKEREIILPTSGSGKNGNIIKPDLIALLNNNTIKPKITLIDIPLGPTLQILDNLEPKDLIEICKTNTKFANICSDDNFWKKRLKKDFSLKVIIPSYRDLYMFNTNMDKQLHIFLNHYTQFKILNHTEQVIRYNNLKKTILGYDIKPNMPDNKKEILKGIITNDLIEIIDSSFFDDTEERWGELFESKIFSDDIIRIYNSLKGTSYKYDDILFYYDSEENDSEDEGEENDSEDEGEESEVY